MPRIEYESKRFSAQSEALIGHAQIILKEYAQQCFVLTLRQLYYQFVARDLLANTEANYKRIGSLINNARLAGLIDWEAIEDRTRNLRELSHWGSPQEIIDDAVKAYSIDKWKCQPCYIEVWVEKDALLGVIQTACDPLEVSYFSCRGYVSQSEMWRASERFRGQIENGKRITLLHLGDHDPSGIDMTRDIGDRLEMFLRGLPSVEVKRIALNGDQIKRYSPPPNPAKNTDSRFANYMTMYGRESWELDALEPRVLIDLIQGTVSDYMDEGLFKYYMVLEEEQREQLRKAAEGMSARHAGEEEQ